MPASSSFDFQIKLNFSLDIQCQGFASLIAWSSNEGGSRYGNTQSTGRLISTDDTTLSLSNSVGPPDLNQYYARPAFFVSLGTVYDAPYPNHKDAFLWEVQPKFCLMPYVHYPVYPDAVSGGETGEAEVISISSQELLINKATSTPYATTWNAETGVYGDYTANCVYLLVQCPLIYGDYVPPTPEPVDPIDNINDNVSDINVNIGEINATMNNIGVAVGGIADGVSDIAVDTDTIRQILLRMESTQTDINTAQFVHTNQLIDIINKLDNIYNNMQECFKSYTCRFPKAYTI